MNVARNQISYPSLKEQYVRISWLAVNVSLQHNTEES